MKAIILAAGLGERLRPITDRIPKCLIPFGNKTLLSTQINILNECGINDVLVVAGYFANKVIEVYPNVVINENYATTNNSHSLAIGLNKINNGSGLILDGDIIYEKRVILDLINNKFEINIATVTAKSVEDIGNRVKYDDEGYVLDIGRNINLAFPWEIFSGIMKVSGNSFNRFRKEAKKNIYKNEEWTLPILALSKKTKVGFQSFNENKYKLININNPDDYEHAKNIFS